MGLVLWHSLFLFLCLVSSSWSLNSDGRALLALSKNLILPSSIKSSWNASDTTPCNWTGISCDKRNNVVSLDLTLSGVSGSLGVHIGLLKYIKVINLPSNNICGPIPQELGNCSMLEQLDVSGNFLSGEIPESLGNLKKLSYLSLYNNSLSGEIPEGLFKNHFLQDVFLNENKLSGSIPSSVGEMTSLRSFWLTQNALSGGLPDSIGNCTKLEELYLLDNRLSGSLPKTLSYVKGLKVLDATGNSFTGEIDFSFENCKLEKFIFSFNQMRGGIPAWLGNCSSLTELALVNNSFSGQIPPSLGLLSNLTLLMLSQNSLSGPIPPEIGNCRLLEWLELDHNMLEGTVPKELANLRHLQKLFLFENRLTGEFPEGIWSIRYLRSVLIYSNGFTGKLPLKLAELKLLENITLFDNFFTGVIPLGLGVNSPLQQIDFTNNSFTGGIPPYICSRKRLRVLVLGFNLLNGSIPSNVADCPGLQRIILRNNDLTGPIPHFRNCAALGYTDFSHNSLSGDIPASLGKCINTTMINWSANKLVGPIPPEIGNLVNLGVLNLSQNSLQGALPAQVSSCSKLYILDLSFNSLHGSALTTLVMLLELQLGGNILGGSIPSSLGKLIKLIALNLSSNGLVGDLRTPLGNLVELQSSDLSVNNLTGGLGALGSLHSLHALNLSYNRFSGPVPEYLLKFLNSAPSSFNGNSGLCISCRDSDSSCKRSNVLKPCGGSGKKGIKRRFKVALIILGSLFIGAVAVFILCCILLKNRDSKTKSEETISNLLEGSSSKLNEIIEKTENFDDKYIIGAGAHGTVYKAILNSGEVFAIKKLAISARSSSYKSMVRELKTLGKVRHRNLIKLKEFWVRGDSGFILYDFMEHGSLYDVLHRIRTPSLDWSMRYNIALGTAHGLAYLHHDSVPAIIHRDIKPSNILLNKDLVPRIADFGIAKIMDQCSAAPQTTGVVGTTGYMAPELAFSTRNSIKTDVYSYGVVLLELITGKTAVDPSFPENMDIVGWVPHALNGAEQIGPVCDPALLDEVYSTVEMEEVRKVLRLALRCTANEPSQRPSMVDVVKELTDARFAGIPSSSKQGKPGSSSGGGSS
uniref:non-specific serine/threonine protein kinase n=1 Tax=Aegilops tauschii subsp. strangulata TaxID=200361 RepID=A0A453QYL0_AEGTS